MIETHQSFVVREECSKAAGQGGYRRPLGENGGWAEFGSTTARGDIYLAAGGQDGPWYLAIEHLGVINELDLKPADMPGPGSARYAFDTLTELYAVLPRVYGFSVSLPDVPLLKFEKEIKGLPRETESERLVIIRKGQGIFRESLLEYWQGECPLTGITDQRLLRASHIKPWVDCQTDAERLDVHNGLMLSALWDAAFDQGLVTFDEKGAPVYSESLSDAARTGLGEGARLPLTDKHQKFLAWHRERVFNSHQVDDGGFEGLMTSDNRV